MRPSEIVRSGSMQWIDSKSVFKKPNVIRGSLLQGLSAVICTNINADNMQQSSVNSARSSDSKSETPIDDSEQSSIAIPNIFDSKSASQDSKFIEETQKRVLQLHKERKERFSAYKIANVKELKAVKNVQETKSVVTAPPIISKPNPSSLQAIYKNNPNIKTIVDPGGMQQCYVQNNNYMKRKLKQSILKKNEPFKHKLLVRKWQRIKKNVIEQRTKQLEEASKHKLQKRKEDEMKHKKNLHASSAQLLIGKLPLALKEEILYGTFDNLVINELQKEILAKDEEISDLKAEIQYAHDRMFNAEYLELELKTLKNKMSGSNTSATSTVIEKNRVPPKHNEPLQSNKNTNDYGVQCKMDKRATSNGKSVLMRDKKVGCRIKCNVQMTQTDLSGNVVSNMMQRTDIYKSTTVSTALKQLNESMDSLKKIPMVPTKRPTFTKKIKKPTFKRRVSHKIEPKPKTSSHEIRESPYTVMSDEDMESASITKSRSISESSGASASLSKSSDEKADERTEEYKGFFGKIGSMLNVNKANEKTEITERNLQKLFKKIDVDKSGVISKDEFMNGTDSLGLKQTKKEMGKLFKAMDTNNSGFLDYDEFRRAIIGPRNTKKMSISSLRQTFDGLDMNQDGILSFHEFKRAADLIGFGKKENLKKYFKLVDKDHSGGVDYKEFVTAMMGTKPSKKEIKYSKKLSKLLQKIERVFKECNLENVSHLTLEQYLNATQALGCKNRNKMKRRFEEFKSRKNERISKNELRKIVEDVLLSPSDFFKVI